jgi:hypothetical protein
MRLIEVLGKCLSIVCTAVIVDMCAEELGL